MAAPLSRPGVYIQETSSGTRAIAGVSTSVAVVLGTASAGPLDTPVRLSSFANYEEIFGGLSEDSELGFAVRQFFLNGGTDAWVVRVARFEGLHALQDIDFNLLCLPGVSDAGVLAAAASYCEERRAFLIVDAPRGATDTAGMTQAVTGDALPRSDHAAVYYPWILVPDPLQNGAPRLTAPSGTIAGLYARSDAERGVWKAPAGTDAMLIGVTSLAAALTDSDNGALNPLGVNCLRTFPGHGPVSWGARTLRGADTLASEYKYVPVRRLALFLEQSLQRGLQWTVFEPNNEPLWARIRQDVGAFMQAQFLAGALQGNNPRDAYFVKCGADTTTQNDISQNQVNLLVGYAPLRPAEFIVLTIRLSASPEPL